MEGEVVRWYGTRSTREGRRRKRSKRERKNRKGLMKEEGRGERMERK